MADALSVGIVADLLEERWTSMDLVADMLIEHLRGTQALDATLLRPTLEPSVLTRISRLANLDRFVRRFMDYPRWLQAQAARFDVFHVVDHSYAHVVHALPADRTVVTCHDADAFLPLVAPDLTRSRLPLRLVRRIHTGLEAARVVACPSAATRDELLHFGLAARERLVVVPNGVHPAFTPAPVPDADAFVDSLLGGASDTIDLLHVGTCIPRKRIDRLLDIVAALRAREPRVRLLKAGGRFTDVQQQQVRHLGLDRSIVVIPFLTPLQLAALYRRAAVVVAPSEREGFGLPVAEAMACGTSVVATDLPVFREVGAEAARYAGLHDTEGWCRQVLDALDEGRSGQRGAARAGNVARAARFSWRAYADTMASIYRAIASNPGVPAKAFVRATA